MIAELILTLPVGLSAPLIPARPAREVAAEFSRAQDPEFDQKLAEAGNDVEKLWQLHLWCKETSRTAEARTVAKKIVENNKDHADARKALGHHFYDNQWFETYTALAKYKREEEAKMKEKGLARLGDQWVNVADLPYLRMKWEKDENGKWESPVQKSARSLEVKFIADGCEKRPEDSTWVRPDEKEKVAAGLWKCGDQWLPIEEANKYHAELGQWWRMEGDHFVLNTTLDRNPGDLASGLPEWSRWWADRTFTDLVRLYGVSPDRRPEVTVLRSLAQFNAFVNGDPAKGIPPTEASGYSACHFAFLAEIWFDGTVQPLEYRGQGVGYWDFADPTNAPFGAFSVRHAAGLSFAEAIDPSWNTISQMIESPGAQGSLATFWSEKRIPRWMRYGGASYVERYMSDPNAAEGAQWDVRNWALAGLKRRSPEFMPLEQFFAFNLDGNDPAGSELLIHSAGLVVAFILDGKCAPVVEKHQAFKAAFKSGGDCAAAGKELEAALTANVAELLKFGQF